MAKVGDVVLGPFPTKDGRVLNHYSVVVQVAPNGDLALAYTTSAKEGNVGHSNMFSKEDMMLAGWSKPCRWDASVIGIVAGDAVRVTGRIPKATMARMQDAMAKAAKSRMLTIAKMPIDVAIAA